MKGRVFKALLPYLMMIAEAFLFAVTVNMFFDPFAIIAGGVFGLSILVNHVLAVPTGLVTIVLNVVILIFAIKPYGKKFVSDCLLTIVFCGIFIDVFSFLPTVTDDKLLSAMYGGIIQGIAVAVSIRYGMSSGGTDLAARLVRRKFGVFGLPVWVAIFDAAIVISGAVVLKDPENLLYALIVIFVSTKVTDIAVVGLNRAKMCYIITDKSDMLAKKLIERSPRGVTRLRGEGMYTNHERDVLFTCVKRYQLSRMKALVKEVDPKAFVIISDVSEVEGLGFPHFPEDGASR